MPARWLVPAVLVFVFVSGAGCRCPAPVVHPAAATSATPAPAATHAHEPAHAHPHAHHRFDDAERWARVFDDPARDAWQHPDEVMRLCELAPGQTVVDLGAGTGYFLASLSRAVGPGGKVLGLDVEQNLVAHMTARVQREGLTNVTAVRVAGDDPGLAPGTVDRVLVVDTWHHLPDRAAYAAKLAATLRPGGLVVVVDFTPETRMGPPPAARVASSVVIAELAGAGLAAALATETLPEQYVVVARKSLAP